MSQNLTMNLAFTEHCVISARNNYRRHYSIALILSQNGRIFNRKIMICLPISTEVLE